MRFIFFLICAATLSAADIDKLAFMTGCWEGPFGDQLNHEQWMRPAGGIMLGTARNVKGDKTTFIEFALIKEVDGKLAMTVQFGIGGKATVLPMLELTTNQVVFGNPPKKVMYRSNGKNGLYARVEGNKVPEEFPMKRVPCK